MAASTGAAPIEKWGVDSEKKIGNEDAQAYKAKVWADAIPWDYDLFRELLEKYSKIPSEEVESEILRIVREPDQHHPLYQNAAIA
ncbi:hypothetical protein NPX13_g6549 [Xylaria arbuscula]|uniref:Uncharacterized protein n=1 Tax=Xylaria arbuscula TaxID=114810 RepID=A0A9W8NCC5_9PEZI|nr:hypothetical protein NPX13_g6549 [Xylaria arbuscula]